ncbi:hypothetical protein N8I77_011843 [Diaporthe amygdali]|uniref:Uncharacterized protein n=1 Tax=Phomopsis amygdali TaxID=1214568 RepID=A0AAD9VZB4_PHOAM|nr:hypothetical protein N8I77_011843 [Diaporthe amygdali]KAK2598424.1 hypothetical protein N8I77_011843 [Diaporthe amygdali]
MESIRQDSTLATRLGYEWNPDFATPQTKSRGGQNVPFWAQGNPNIGLPQDTDDILSRFLGEVFDDAGPFLYQAVPIREFCLPADISILAAGNDTRLQRKMALLDERNDEGLRKDARGTCRRSLHDGALGASDLYESLRKKRYNESYHSATGTAVTTSSNNRRNTHEADADRRLIYITDIDSWCMLAIVSTVPSLQAAFLRDFVYRHIEFKTHVGVQVPTSGFQNFALEFHLPFYACKKGPELVKDQRLKTNQKPLRRTGDLQFLKLAPFQTDASGLDDCIYEAQISVLVTGVDHWSWTAFAFVDTYYKGPENQESVEHYLEQVQYGARLDPLTEGQYYAEPPVWRPREYFLRVLESRVKQVKREWHNTVFRILQRIEPQTHDDLLSEPEHRQGHVLDRDTQIFFDKTIRLLQQMSYLISLTVDAWMRFMNVELAYFTNLENLPGKQRTPIMLISEINKEVEDLLVLRKNLDHQRDLLYGLSQKVR